MLLLEVHGVMDNWCCDSMVTCWFEVIGGVGFCWGVERWGSGVLWGVGAMRCYGVLGYSTVGAQYQYFSNNGDSKSVGKLILFFGWWGL
ncbi:hypothetical protein U1Q18_041467 [Sarracenia purpurea var. burkii]